RAPRCAPRWRCSACWACGAWASASVSSSSASSSRAGRTRRRRTRAKSRSGVRAPDRPTIKGKGGVSQEAPPFSVVRGKAPAGSGARGFSSSEGLAQPDLIEGARVDEAVLDKGDRPRLAIRELGELDVEVVPDVDLGADRQGRRRLILAPQLIVVVTAPAR